MKIYANDKYIAYLKRCTRRYYKEQEPEVEVVPNGIIANEHGNGYGVFDKKCNFVKSSIQNHKGRKGQFVPKINCDNIEYVNSDAVYLCHCGKNNFGHFLVEYINRAWCLSDKKYQNMKIVIVNEIGCEKINDYIYVLLGLLGIKSKNIILLDKTTRFRNVYIPSPAFDISAYYTDAARCMFDNIAKNTPDKNEQYDKIYLSRTAMPADRHTYGEKTIQKIFKKNGYKIIWPEKLPLVEQIALVKNCKYLAGCAGTALHLAWFMKPGGTVIQIKRNTAMQDNADTQYLINTVKGVDSVFVAASVERAKTEHYSLTPQIIGMTKYMKQFFDDNNFAYNEKDFIEFDKELAAYDKALKNCKMQTFSTKRIKKYFIKYMACFVIGRGRRDKFRKFLKKLLKYEA